MTTVAAPDANALQGLNCPRCGRPVPIPQGEAIVKCPACDFRALVQGENGVRYYQVPNRTPRDRLPAVLSQFLSSHWAIALNARGTAQLTEVFLAYVPFWSVWGRLLGWAFGQDEQGSGKNRRWVSKEVKIAEDVNWNGAACDVGEFGVTRVELKNQPLEPYDDDRAHAAGMVFEPTTSMSEAQQQARAHFHNKARSRASLDRLNQLFLRVLHERFGVVFYPLWVMRYLYRSRAFQVVVDGFDGRVLYGKAPGNTWYRAGALVLGMALGAFIALTVPTLILAVMIWGDIDSDSAEGLVAGMVVALVVGSAIMYGSYRAFRFGEVYEYQRFGGRSNVANPFNAVKDFFK